MKTDAWHEWPEWAKDAVITVTEVCLSMLDAIRVLIRRRFTVECKTFTGEIVGRTETLSDVRVPPIVPRRPQLGYVEASPAPEAPTHE